MHNYYLHLSTILAASSSKTTASSSSTSTFFIMLILFGVIAWFGIIRPQKNRQRKMAQQTSQIEPGDEVVTIGGIIGTVVEIVDDRMVLRVSNSDRANPAQLGVELTFLRQAIARKLEPAPGSLDTVDQGFEQNAHSDEIMHDLDQANNEDDR